MTEDWEETCWLGEIVGSKFIGCPNNAQTAVWWVDTTGFDDTCRLPVCLKHVNELRMLPLGGV